MKRIVRCISSIRVSAAARRIGMCLAVLILIAGFAASAKAQIYYVVDCSGANPADFPTIASALRVALAAPPSASLPNTYILLASPCTENVFMNGATNLSLGAFWEQNVSITGNISISNSTGVFFTV